MFPVYLSNCTTVNYGSFHRVAQLCRCDKGIQQAWIVRAGAALIPGKVGTTPAETAAKYVASRYYTFCDVPPATFYVFFFILLSLLYSSH